MKVLVIADVHGNLAALEAVLSEVEHDELFVLGDIVGYGPHPKECLAKVMHASDVDVQGDHDRALVNETPTQAPAVYQRMADETLEWTRQQGLQKWLLDYVRALPPQSAYELRTMRYRCMHGSPDEPVGGVIDENLSEDDLMLLLSRYEEEIIMTAHSHLPQIRRAGEKLLVNPGSVGQPRDGNPEACCVLVTDGVPTIVRVPYDVEETVTALERMDTVSEEVRAQLAQVLRTARDPE